MSFKMKYTITPKYLTSGSKRRSGIALDKARFSVAHDTGNPNSTALGNVTFYENSRNETSASAHIFVDDKGIWECIPCLTTTRPEKAWHVLYEKPTDNKLFGDDANDCAVGVEYCYGTNINADETYKRYVWVLAYAAYKLGYDPKNVVGHHILDPERKTDPVNGLSKSGRTYAQLLKDIVAEYKDCTTEVKAVDLDNIPVIVNDVLVAHGREINGSVFVPVRKIGDALGRAVAWDSVKKVPTLDKKPLTDYLMFNDLTYVKVRVAAEMFGAKVTWNQEQKKVYIYK